MDFFRSVFADEPDPPPPKPATDSQSQTPPEHQSNSDSGSDSDSPPPNEPHSNPNPDGSSGWSSFGGLIRTLTTKSESVIETYRRDLKEFSTGLRKEIEVAQGSLENVGQTFDEIGTTVIKGTAQIISHGKEAILSLDQESDSSDADRGSSSAAGQSSSYDSRRYSRFDAQVRALQGDASTFCDEPEDLDDYGKWRSSEFVLQENREEIESLLEENGTLDAIYKKVVPGSVDEETFWSRYYYRIYKLKQAEALRANLVKRAISAEEEDLSWDVDDDEEDDEEWKGKATKAEEKSKGDSEENQELKSRDYLTEVAKSDAIEPVVQNPIEDEKMGDGKSGEIVQNAKAETVSATPTVEEPKVENNPSAASASASASANVQSSERADEIKEETKSAENSGSEGNGGNGGSCKDSDYSVVSSHQTVAEEEDLGWDEIEDLSGIDDGKKEERRVSQNGSSVNKEELRKRLSVAEEEEEEDLSWDIEDDDEPVKP